MRVAPLTVERDAKTQLAAGYTAVDVARLVRAGELSPTSLIESTLARIQRHDLALGAFASVRHEQAMAEARALTSDPQLPNLALAGVPIAVKDNVPVRGEVMRGGSTVYDTQPQSVDHPVVARLREAGAVIVGLTTTPELGLWLTTDGEVITRNPWNCDRSASGSSGGSAAAVAAGLALAAQGNDGLGSVRQPAAACGIVGIKPGRGLVPSMLASSDWYGLAENGAMAATVADAALMLSVMASDAALAQVSEPVGVLRVAVSVKPPVHGTRGDAETKRAVFGLAGTLRREGHIVERAQPAYPRRLGLAGTFRWMAVAADSVDTANAELDATAEPRPATHQFQQRTLGHASAGRRVRPLIKDDQLADWRARAENFFESFDVMLTPVTAAPPLPAEAWSERSWAANVRANVTGSGGFAGMWNVAGFPAITVPFGVHPDTRTPIGVQLAAPAGSERLLIGLAATIERLHPWPLTAPGWE